MINSFIIRAIPGSNVLKVVLDGTFMKSEVELALLLIKTEKLKLKDGFQIVADLRNFKSKGNDLQTGYYKIQQQIKASVYQEEDMSMANTIEI